ncbi:glutathione S-transferase [Rhizorhabdus sp.]|uniref:glutathione S-transferase n=1 Tax=Rhizorhabdus sp. TaxID=1968843 RepID=UPI00199F46E4|nr:glutathione S-transferase [Rhizorhabdus sp.]MBD3759120.1 glutathione S-transferase [Rhizorhabdus sp.]
MADRPILYSFRRCPYAMRARMALLASGTVCELREVKLSDKPGALIAASPKGTVPVLVLPDRTVIDQSIDIMRWALSRNDPEGWLGGDDAALIAANDGPFKHHLDRYKYPGRYGTDAAEHRAAGLALLGLLEERLAQGAYLSGGARGLADIAVMPFVRQFAETDRGWFDSQPVPALRAWLAGLLASPLFAAAMLRVPPWAAGQPAVLFPAVYEAA